MKNKMLRITMPDGSKYDVPVMIIAKDRAENYKDEFGGDVERSLMEDTIPLFENDSYEIHDWAANNMNWCDVAKYAKKVEKEQDVDFDEGWANGEYEIIAT